MAKNKWNEFNNAPVSPKAPATKKAIASSWSEFNGPVQAPAEKQSIVKSLAAGVIKTPARLATNVVQAAEIATGKEKTQPFSGKFLGEVKPVGMSGNFKKDLQDSVGAGLELASYLPVAKGVSTSVGLLSNASKWAKFAAPLAVEGAAAGFLGSSGKEISDNASEGTKISAKNIAIGTGAGAVAGPILGAAFKGAGKILGKGAEVAESSGSKVNIGMNISDGTKVKESEIYNVLKKLGVEVKESAIHASDTEPTWTGKLSRPLTDEEMDILSLKLRQEAIPQVVDGEGKMYGPQKDKWGEFNPEYFLETDGTPMAQKAPERLLLPAPKEKVAISAPEEKTLLPERTQTKANQGEGFSFSDKTSKSKIEYTNSFKDYQRKLAAYNKKPTPERLKAVQDAREVVKAKDAAVKANEAPKAPKESQTPKEPKAAPVIESPMSNAKIPFRPKMPSINGDKVTKEANDITDTLVKKGYEELEPEVKASFKSANVETELKNVSEFIKNNGDAALESAKTGKGIPKGVNAQILFNAIKHQAMENLDNGGAETLRDLARSPIASQKSIAAQTLRLSQEGRIETDPVQLIADNNKAIADKIFKTTGKTVEKLKADAVKEFTPKLERNLKPKVTKQTLAEFISSIKC